MKNNIPFYENSADLVKEDRETHQQMPIFLDIDWINQKVDITPMSKSMVPTVTRSGSTTLILLPYNIDATRAYMDINQYMFVLDIIKKGVVWNGYRTTVSHEAREIINVLLKHTKFEETMHLSDKKGFVSIEEYCEDLPDIPEGMSDTDIQVKAEEMLKEAYNKGAVIKGGVQSIVEMLIQLRDGLMLIEYP